MSELKNCPFCGNEEYKPDIEYDSHYNSYQVICGYCCATAPDQKTKNEAIKAWNTRHESAWIKCSERLPEPSKYCLLFIASVKNGGCIAVGCRGTPTGTKPADYYADSDNNWYARQYMYRDWEVTHWRELPPLPMEDGE